MTPETPREGREQRNEYRLGVCPHGIYRDTRCFNCDPETPREAGRQDPLRTLGDALEAIASVVPEHDAQVPVDGKPFTRRVARLILTGLLDDPAKATVVVAALAAADRRAERGLPLDPSVLLATLTDRFHEARAGTPEWRDGIRLGLQIAMNEVGYWSDAALAADPQSPTGE